MIQIIDNFLPEEYADLIENVLLGRYFEWYFLDDVTHMTLSDNVEKTLGFSHYYFDDGQAMSNHFSLVYKIPETYYKETPFNTIQVRSFLQIAQPHRREHDHKHTDRGLKHTVLLYYVNDSDGDTFLFGKDINDPVSKRVTPKKNRLVVFDGDIFHASSQPTVGKRCIINFNISVV